MRKKITIELRLSGKTVKRFELSALEYEVIRRCPPQEAIRCLMQKDAQLRADPALVLQVLQLITSGNFRTAALNDEDR